MARWIVELNCYCPNCDDYVDLTESDDFWDDRQLDPCENNTDRSRGVEVMCPECDYEFVVDCEY